VWLKLCVEIRFGLLFIVFFALLYWLLMGAHGKETQWNVEDLMTRSVVWVSGQILALLGIAFRLTVQSSAAAVCTVGWAGAFPSAHVGQALSGTDGNCWPE
jgi:hypothetical protein